MVCKGFTHHARTPTFCLLLVSVSAACSGPRTSVMMPRLRPQCANRNVFSFRSSVNVTYQQFMDVKTELVRQRPRSR